jgi:hypothetical protein
MVEHILMKQVGFIEQEDRMGSFAPEVFDVRADREEDASGRR